MVALTGCLENPQERDGTQHTRLQSVSCHIFARKCRGPVPAQMQTCSFHLFQPKEDARGGRANLAAARERQRPAHCGFHHSLYPTVSFFVPGIGAKLCQSLQASDKVPSEIPLLIVHMLTFSWDVIEVRRGFAALCSLQLTYTGRVATFCRTSLELPSGEGKAGKSGQK